MVVQSESLYNLVCGKEVWWISTDEGYMFLDGNSDPCWNPAGLSW